MFYLLLFSERKILGMQIINKSCWVFFLVIKKIHKSDVHTGYTSARRLSLEHSLLILYETAIEIIVFWIILHDQICIYDLVSLPLVNTAFYK